MYQVISTWWDSWEEKYMRIIDERTVRMTVEIQQFLADYWLDVDENRGVGASLFYTDDCVTGIEGAEKVGPAAVAEFHRNRTSRAIRTTRHTFSNLRVVPSDDDSATVAFAVVNYASDGPPPIIGRSAPSLVTQVNCECVRGKDGYWRFKRMIAKPLFIGDEPYTVEVLVKGKK